jgi:hypothetical protein
MVKTMTINFQRHYDKPDELLQGTYLATIGNLVALMAGMGFVFLAHGTRQLLS